MDGWRSGNDIASDAGGLGFNCRSNQTQCRQWLATAAIFLRNSKLCRLGAKLRRWAPQLVKCFGVVRRV